MVAVDGMGSLSLASSVLASHVCLCTHAVYVTHRSEWEPRLPSTLDSNVPQYKRDFWRTLIYFCPQPVMCKQLGNCQIKVCRNHIFEDSYIDAIDPSVYIQRVPPRQCTAGDIVCFRSSQVLPPCLLPPISFVQESGATVYHLHTSTT